VSRADVRSTDPLTDINVLARLVDAMPDVGPFPCVQCKRYVIRDAGHWFCSEECERESEQAVPPAAELTECVDCGAPSLHRLCDRCFRVVKL
jgi:hypothetical protein